MFSWAMDIFIEAYCSLSLKVIKYAGVSDELKENVQ